MNDPHVKMISIVWHDVRSLKKDSLSLTYDPQVKMISIVRHDVRLHLPQMILVLGHNFLYSLHHFLLSKQKRGAQIQMKLTETSTNTTSTQRSLHYIGNGSCD